MCMENLILKTKVSMIKNQPHQCLYFPQMVIGLRHGFVLGKIVETVEARKTLNNVKEKQVFFVEYLQPEELSIGTME